MASNLLGAKAEDIMRICIDEAELAVLSGNPPFACIIVDHAGQIVVQTHNTQSSDSDPAAHAEIKALHELGRNLQTTYFKSYVVFANAESCAMCIFACAKANIREFYFGAPPKQE